jgi:DNA replication protein DnaC
MSDSPEPTPAADSAAILTAKLEAMMAIATEREARFATELDATLERTPAFLLGPCPSCRTVGRLDRDATLNESVAHNRLILAYQVCEACDREAAMQERLARMGVPRRVRGATFANYEVYDPRQAQVLEAVRAWVRDPERWLLCLLGSYGAGKGHLASAAVRAYGMTASWITHPNILNDYYGTPFEHRPKFKNRFKRFPFLVLDEMGTKAKTADTEELFFDILNLRHEEGLKTILIGNVPLRSEKGLNLLDLIGGERMASRMASSATVLTCRWEDYRTRARE